MASVNRAILVGNLGADPETRYLPSGDAICNLRLATTDRTKDKATGEYKEVTEWHRVVFFGKTAETANQYLTKGKQIYVEGRIRTNKWQDKDGNERYTTEIVGNEMKMLGSKSDSGERQTQPARTAPAASPSRPAAAPTFDDDDIPF